jgi:hypothetical protein
MPKGPNGQKRPADSVGMSVMVARIATGEISDTISPSKKINSGRAGAAARNAALSKDERLSIARIAAQARWKNGEDDPMTQQLQSVGAATQEAERVVQMYPNNQLKDQVRKFDQTKSAFSVVKDEFFAN